MSTRGYIYVATKKEAMGKRLRFDINLCKQLPVVERDDDRRDYIPYNTRNFKHTDPVSKPFVGAYCAADSYITGAGLALVKYFNSYRKAINLMAGGVMNSLHDQRLVYSSALRENHTPEETGMIQDDNPTLCENYQYLFYEGKWYVRKFNSYWYDVKQVFTDLHGVDNREIESSFWYSMEEMKEYLNILPCDVDISGEGSVAYLNSYKDFEEAWKKMLPTPENVRRIKLQTE